MIQFELEKNGYNMLITYSKKGHIEHVKNIDTGEYMMIESKFNGSGYNITEDKMVLTNNIIKVCDARYTRVIDANIFLPYRLYITE